MNYTPILVIFVGIFFFVGLQQLFLGFIMKFNVVNMSFGLLALAMAGLEVNSVYAIKATNLDSFILSFKLIWFFLLLVQIIWIYFLSIFTQLIYKKFISLFVVLSLLAIVLNLLLPTGLMRGEVIGFKLRPSIFNETEAYITTKFSIYSLLEFVLILFLNVYTIILSLKYFKRKHNKYPFWLIVSFVVFFLSEINDFLVMARVLDFYLIHLGYLFVISTLSGVLFRNYIKSINAVEEFELQQDYWKMKEEIVHMIVHDLKLPLNNLINIPENLSKEENVDRIQSNANRIQYHIFDILEVHRSENPDFKIQTSNCNINDIIQVAFGNVRFIIRQKKQTFIFETDKEYFVDADRNLIERVFINLLSNAVKYTPIDGVIQIELHEINEIVLEILVIDNGIGIEKGKLDLIFNRFEVIDKTNRQTLPSTGLGLSFCKMSVEAHGSKLKVVSVFGEGTTVGFDLNIVRVNTLVNKFSIVEKSELIYVPDMSIDEVNYLLKYYHLLQNCSLNKISLLRRLIKIMENDQYVNKRWLQQLHEASNDFRENSFRELISIIKPPID